MNKSILLVTALLVGISLFLAGGCGSTTSEQQPPVSSAPSNTSSIHSGDGSSIVWTESPILGRDGSAILIGCISHDWDKVDTYGFYHRKREDSEWSVYRVKGKIKAGMFEHSLKGLERQTRYEVKAWVVFKNQSEKYISDGRVYTTL